MLVGPFQSSPAFAPLFLFELPVIAGVAFLVKSALRVGRDVPLISRFLILFTLLFPGVSTLVNGASVGAFQTARLCLLTVIILIISLMSSASVVRVFTGALVSGACLQTLVALGQWVAGGPIGLSVLGEGPAFIAFGDSLAVQGTFHHPYLFAGYCVVAVGAAVLMAVQLDAWRWVWAGAAFLSAVPIGLTYSRMSVLGMLAFFVCLFVRCLKDRRMWLVAICVLLGASLPAIVDSSGWVDRAGSSSAAVNLNGAPDDRVDAFTSGRLTFIRQAVTVVSEHPWLGVGPGRYLPELERMGEGEGGQQLYPVHMVPLLFAAESGVLAGALLVLLLVLLALRSLRAGILQFGLFLAFLPFILFDHFPYTQPQGTAVAALWVGLLVAWEDLDALQVQHGSNV